MKKLLIGIFTFLIGFISFSSALTIQDPELCVLYTGNIDGPDSVIFQDWNVSKAGSYVLAGNYDLTNGYPDMAVLTQYWGQFSLDFYEESYYYYAMMLFPSEGCSQSGGGSSSSDITVYYNNGSSTSIACDGQNSIAINGLSTLYGDSTFVPFFNISYVDENNQKLIESYDKTILYLDPGQFKKTYTGNNDWILSVQGGSDGGFNIISSGFDITGEIVSPVLSGNMFKNFIDTGYEVLFSNIPSYIQYVILIAILLLFLRIFRKRKKF